MRISEEYFNKLCPSYQDAIRELEKDLSEFDDQKSEKTNIMLDFAANYLMPLPYWKEIISYEYDHDEDYYEEVDPLLHSQLYYHFYFDVSDAHNDDFPKYRYKKTLTSIFAYRNMDDFNDEVKECHLYYPHSHLTECFYELEKNSCEPLPKELISKYEANKKMYDEIKAAKYDVEKWFTLLCEFDGGENGDNEEFVRHNVEYRLGTNFLDIKLWKLYIEYLRICDSKEMLQVYSKYCRFFLDDLEMQEKYKNEVAEYGPVFVLWRNLFDFERQSKQDFIEYLYEPFEKNIFIDDCEKPWNDWSSYGGYSNQLTPLCKVFYDTYRKQVFPFKKPIMTYILDNANYFVLKKLHQTCKHFFKCMPIPICHRLAFHFSPVRVTKFTKDSLDMSASDKVIQLHNTAVTTTFLVNDKDALHLPTILLKLYRCDAKYIYFEGILSVAEMKFLLEGGNVVIFNWTTRYLAKDVKIVDEIMLEEIMQYLPKIEKLKIFPAYLNSNTFKVLLNQKFLSHIYSLQLYGIKNESFNTNDLLEFCIKNRSNRFYLAMSFLENFVDRTFVNEMEQKMKDYETCTKHTVTSFWLQ